MNEVLQVLIQFMTITSLIGAVSAAVTYAVWQARGREQAETRAEIEREIVRAAALHGGRITAIDVRTRQTCSVADVEERLRWMHAHGYCESEIRADGLHVFLFLSYDDAPLRQRAVERDILLYARIHGGVVEAGKVALLADLTYTEARALLDEMARLGECTTGDRHDLYEFPVFQSGARVEAEATDGRPWPLPEVAAQEVPVGTPVREESRDCESMGTEPSRREQG